MPVQWRITYVVSPPVRITPAATELPSLHLELAYDDDGGLTRATHTVETTGADVGVAYDHSREDLLAFWEAVRYASGMEVLTVRAVHAEGTGGHIGNVVYLARPAPSSEPPTAKLPDLAKLQAAPGRLPTWLILANAARADRDDIGALRNYFVILEEIHGEGAGHTNPGLEGIWCVRHFVSHARVRSQRTRAFLEKELGYPAAFYQYDAHDLKHRRLVHKYRKAAQREVEAELGKYM